MLLRSLGSRSGNMISDALNKTGSIKYDNRNLMTEIRAIKTEAGGGIGGGTVEVLYLTKYRYDEAGNRVHKVRYKYTGSDPNPVFEGDRPKLPDLYSASWRSDITKRFMINFLLLVQKKVTKKSTPAGKSNCSNIKAKIEEFVNSLTLKQTNSVIIALMFSLIRLIFPNGIEKLTVKQ